MSNLPAVAQPSPIVLNDHRPIPTVGMALIGADHDYNVLHTPIPAFAKRPKPEARHVKSK